MFFQQLTRELDVGFESGAVCTLQSVKDRFCQILQDNDATEANCRSSKLKEKIQKHYGSSVEFCHQRGKQSQLMFPALKTGIAVEALKHTVEEIRGDGFETSQKVQPSLETEFLM